MEIHERHAGDAWDEVVSRLRESHADCLAVIESYTDEELFTKKYYSFTGSSDLATYFTSATGGHYRSAYKHINRWWRANKREYDTA